MNLKDLVRNVVIKEKGKSNVKIGDIREIVGILSDILYLDHILADKSTYKTLLSNGKRRVKKLSKIRKGPQRLRRGE